MTNQEFTAAEGSAGNLLFPQLFLLNQTQGGHRVQGTRGQMGGEQETLQSSRPGTTNYSLQAKTRLLEQSSPFIYKLSLAAFTLQQLS